MKSTSILSLAAIVVGVVGSILSEKSMEKAIDTAIEEKLKGIETKETKTSEEEQ